MQENITYSLKLKVRKNRSKRKNANISTGKLIFDNESNDLCCRNW